MMRTQISSSKALSQGPCMFSGKRRIWDNQFSSKRNGRGSEPGKPVVGAASVIMAEGKA